MDALHLVCESMPQAQLCEIGSVLTRIQLGLGVRIQGIPNCLVREVGLGRNVEIQTREIGRAQHGGNSSFGVASSRTIWRNDQNSLKLGDCQSPRHPIRWGGLRLAPSVELPALMSLTSGFCLEEDSCAT